MTRINTNVGSLRGLRSNAKASDLLQTSLTRLSTGLKINSGKDNPSGLIASEKLKSQISAINQSINNSNRANNVLSTADGALGEIGGLLTQVRGLVQEGLNKGALSQDEIDANQQQIDTALSAINRIGANTTFAGSKLIDGSKAFTTSVSNADAAKLSDVQINQAVLGGTGSLDLKATVNTAAQKANLVYAGGLNTKTTIEIGGAKGSEAVFLGGSSSLTDVRDAINGVSDTTGVSARVMSGLTQDVAAASAKTTVAATTGGPGSLTVSADAAGTDGNKYSIEFVAGSGNNVATTAAFGTGADANKITVTLGTDGSGALDATKNTLANVASAVGNLDGVSATSTGTGSVNAAAAATSLSGGAEKGEFVLSDVRAPGTAGNVSLSMAGGASQTFGITVTKSGNDTSVAVQLATDANGNVTTTLKDLTDALNANDDLKGTAVATTNGDGNAVAATVGFTPAVAGVAASTSIAGGTSAIPAVAASSTTAATTGTGSLSVTADAPGAGGNVYSIEFVAGSGNNVATSAAFGTGVDANKITVTLGTDAGGLLDATKNTTSLIATAVDALSGVSATGTGTGSINAATANASFTGGTNTVAAVANTGTLSVTADAAGAAGNDYSIEFVAGSGNNVATTAAFGTGANANKITVTLGTGSSGALDDTKNTLSLIATAVGALNGVSATSTGTGSVLGAAAATSLTGGVTAVAAQSAGTTLSTATGGALALESSDYGSAEFVNVNVLSGSFATVGTDGADTRRDAGVDIGVTINGQTAQTKGLTATLRTNTLDATLSFKASSNAPASTTTVSITGGGSLFQIGQEVSPAGQIGIGIDAVNTARLGGIAGKLYELGSGGGKSLNDINSGNANGGDAVDIIEQAINRVSTLRGRIGAVQKNVIDTNVSNLGVALENISEANSQITDTDFASETANLTKAQILSQASISVLGIANQTPQQVLSLLG